MADSRKHVKEHVSRFCLPRPSTPQTGVADAARNEITGTILCMFR